jgi:hypothetical protein
MIILTDCAVFVMQTTSEIASVTNAPSTIASEAANTPRAPTSSAPTDSKLNFVPAALPKSTSAHIFTAGTACEALPDANFVCPAAMTYNNLGNTLPIAQFDRITFLPRTKGHETHSGRVARITVKARQGHGTEAAREEGQTQTQTHPQLAQHTHARTQTQT